MASKNHVEVTFCARGFDDVREVWDLFSPQNQKPLSESEDGIWFFDNFGRAGRLIMWDDNLIAERGGEKGRRGERRREEKKGGKEGGGEKKKKERRREDRPMMMAVTPSNPTSIHCHAITNKERKEKRKKDTYGLIPSVDMDGDGEQNFCSTLRCILRYVFSSPNH